MPTIWCSSSPAAIFYDYPVKLDGEHRLCPAFLASLANEQPLDDEVCFKGNCPTRDDPDAVCPSGFWGFRHFIGFPVTNSEAQDSPVEIPFEGQIEVDVACSTDLAQYKSHESSLRNLKAANYHGSNASRKDILDLLKTTHPHIVYFYCHGGVSLDLPCLWVGAIEDPLNLYPNVKRNRKIQWDSSRPVVFMNGCHTADLEPDKAVDLVSALVENAYASGVVGTEITIFEELASAFGERFIQLFLGGATIGEAIRSTRLALLKQGNPLGLAYVPYAMAGLRLVKTDVR